MNLVLGVIILARVPEFMDTFGAMTIFKLSSSFDALAKETIN